MPDGPIDLVLEARDLGPELAIQHGQRVEVDGDARRFHAGEHGDERQLDLAEQPLETFFLEGAGERVADREGRQRLETGAMDRLELLRRRQDEVEPLGDNVRDRL